MFYLFIYIAFFSIPLLYPFLISCGLGLLSGLPLPYSLRLSPDALRRQPHMLVLALFSVVAAIVVHFNTIVHPFTLADNRHYTFYVFRLLLRHPAIKYLVTPIYILAAWAAIQCLGTPIKLTASARKDVKDDNGQQKPKGTKVSIVLVWLFTSALQLITAPLVEPRYFILPWLVWRHLVAEANESRASSSKRVEGHASIIDWIKRTFIDQRDHRLYLETLWFLLINVITGYIFLNWAFEWPQEPGMVQRFMW